MKVALGIEYDGGAFRGFQRQSNAPSVQQALEAALSRVAAAPVRIAAAGRTDAGVHATAQVVAFEAPVERPLSAWVRGVNSLTPAALKVRWARPVDAGFHPRYAAVARRYQYLFLEAGPAGDGPLDGRGVGVEDSLVPDTGKPSPLAAGFATRVRALDHDAMHRAAQALVGEHDFSTFRGAGCQSRSAHRCVHRVSVLRAASLVVLDITANAFLLHMARNVAGALQQVGEGQASEAWLAQALARRDRNSIGRTAPAGGLYLVDVSYPGHAFPAGQPPPLLRALGGLDRF